MDKSDFFKNQLLKSLNENLGERVGIESLEFVILPSNGLNETSKNTWDEFINSWVLPAKTEIKLTLDEAIETLSSRQGLFPLWIKLKAQDKGLILLNISKRFRKINDIKEFHKDNENMPFVFDQSLDLTFTNEIERSGLIKKLLWSFELNDREKKVFEKSPLTFVDIEFFFDNHFKSYTYFPPDYNHRSPNAKNYSKLIIKRDNGFSIIANVDTNTETSILYSSDLKEIIETYFDKELNNKIDNLAISI